MTRPRLKIVRKVVQAHLVGLILWAVPSPVWAQEKINISYSAVAPSVVAPLSRVELNVVPVVLLISEETQAPPVVRSSSARTEQPGDASASVPESNPVLHASQITSPAAPLLAASVFGLSRRTIVVGSAMSILVFLLGYWFYRFLRRR